MIILNHISKCIYTTKSTNYVKGNNYTLPLLRKLDAHIIPMPLVFTFLLNLTLSIIFVFHFQIESIHLLTFQIDPRSHIIDLNGLSHAIDNHISYI